MKRVYVTNSPEETETLGSELSNGFSGGERVGLIGDLGSGKTRLVRGIAKGLGSKGFIKSPSFTIINIYEGGRLPLYHIDLYRIGRFEEFHDAGLEEFIYGKGISVIEWVEKLPWLIKDCTVLIRLKYAGETGREIEVEHLGAGKN